MLAPIATATATAISSSTVTCANSGARTATGGRRPLPRLHHRFATCPIPTRPAAKSRSGAQRQPGAVISQTARPHHHSGTSVTAPAAAAPAATSRRTRPRSCTIRFTRRSVAAPSRCNKEVMTSLHPGATRPSPTTARRQIGMARASPACVAANTWYGGSLARRRPDRTTTNARYLRQMRGVALILDT